jgi:hypothetical protein
MNRSLPGAAALVYVAAVAALGTSSGAARFSLAPSVTRSAAAVETTNTKLGTVLADVSGRVEKRGS